MGKRRLLFCIRDFNHGGIPKSLENLLALMDKDKYDISIFCAYQQGYYKSVFAKYNILPQNRLLYWFCVNYKTLNGVDLIIALIIKSISKLFLKINVDLFDLYLKHVANKISADKRFDTVIAFAEGWITHFVSYMTGVERRVAWIHMDYKRILAYESGKRDAVSYPKFDYIISPCQFSAKSFKGVYPELSDKVIAVKNVLDVDMIKSQSMKPVTDGRFSADVFTIISVGRICYEKQFFEIPRIVDEVRKTYSAFKWYIVGSGPEAEVAILEDNIRKYNVEDYVILLGGKDNPYPYIAKSNLLALLSLSETFSYVAYEAKILGVPLITTDFGASKEIVEDGVGVIVPKEKFAAELISLIANELRYENMKQSLENYNYDNNFILSQVDNLLN